MNTRETDAALLRRYAQERCEEAFRGLVERHGPAVHRAALRQLDGDAHMAADVGQRVFIELARHAARLAHHPALVGWLHTTVWRTCQDLRRREGRRGLRERAAVDDAEPWVMPVPPDGEPMAAWIDALLQSLGEVDRRALLLRHVEHLPYAEVGRRLGLRENAARMRTDRALERLRALLVGRGIASSAAAIGRVLGGGLSRMDPGTVERWVGASLVAGSVGSVPVVLSTLTAGVQLKTVLAGVAALAVGGGFWWQHRQLDLGRLEIERLRAELRRMETAQAASRSELDRAAAERVAFDRERAELVRLRGSVATLRAERDEARARAAAQPPAPDAAASDAGTAAPDAEFNLAFVHTRIAPGQSLITGGTYVDAAGRRAMVLITPWVETNPDGKRIVGLDSRIAMVPSEVAMADPGGQGLGGRGELRSISSEGGARRTVGLLDSDALSQMRQFLEASPGVDILAAPKVTVADGMQGQIQVMGDGTSRGGLSLDFLPVVADDGGIDLTVLGRIVEAADDPGPPVGRGTLEGLRGPEPSSVPPRDVVPGEAPGVFPGVHPPAPLPPGPTRNQSR